MKKHLIAAAVTTAIAAPAMAQNVSLYGTFDEAIVMTKNQGGQDVTNLTSGTVSSSVLGFKGAEDLGGGLKALVQFEGNMNHNGTNTINAEGQLGKTAGNFDREAWVGMAGGFGEVRLGRTDVTGVQGIDGLGSSKTLGNIDDFGGSLGKDGASAIRYTSPTMNGFKFDAGLQMSATTNTASGTADITSAGVYYTAGAISVAAGQTQKEVAGATSDKETQFAARYNAGAFAVGVARQAYSSATASSEFTTTQVGVDVPLGNGMTLGASYKNYNKKTTNTSDVKRTAVALAKGLSKRTTVYAGYINDSKGGTTADVSQLALGVIHKF